MPNRPVMLNRWQLVAAFLLLVASSVAVALWNDHRIDQAETRILRNSASITDLRLTNAAQNALRNQIVRRARHADLTICQETEKIKERIRATVHVDRASFQNTLAQLGIEPDSSQGLALFAQAKASERETLARFSPKNCKALTVRP